ncbi:MAG: class I SAM-dependent methyltransferase [Myxococcales bacterium]|nr:class I SAM-dependent methyltransferase [Myxococcales bacterium]
MDVRERFSAGVDLYVTARPTYPDDLIAQVIARSPGPQIVDLGAGTGISSRAFARVGARRFGGRVRVSAVEPNASMRAAGESPPSRESVAGVDFRAGDAEGTGLPDSCADLVVGCQAFHWFDLGRTLPEIDRILGVGGVAAALWNHRSTSPFLDAYEAFLLEWSADYRAIRTVEATIADLRSMRQTDRIVFPSGQRLTMRGLHDRVWSASYVQHGVSDRVPFDAALDTLFQTYADQRGGEAEPGVDFDYDSIAVMWGV